MAKFFKVENISKLRKITINNSKKKNALNTQAYQELTGRFSGNQRFNFSNLLLFHFADILKGAATDDNVSICAITGEGEYYSSGNDLTAFMASADPAADLQRSRGILKNLIKAFYEFPKPLICVVNGPCIGIAATTAALADIIYASEKVSGRHFALS